MKTSDVKNWVYEEDHNAKPCQKIDWLGKCYVTSSFNHDKNPSNPKTNKTSERFAVGQEDLKLYWKSDNTPFL